MATKYEAECQVCEGNYRLRGERVVLHGYARPGDGHAHGRCPGVGESPYELSCEAVERHGAAVRAGIPSTEQRLADLREPGKVTYLERLRVRGSDRRVEVRQYALGVSEPLDWDAALRAVSCDVESRLAWARSEVARCERRVAAWQLRPVREVAG